MPDIILSRDIRNQIYFQTTTAGQVDLVIDPAIRYAQGPIVLSVAAAEDLLVNLQVNSEHARVLANAQAQPKGAGFGHSQNTEEKQ
jgi:hypothetical protein